MSFRIGRLFFASYRTRVRGFRFRVHHFCPPCQWITAWFLRSAYQVAVLCPRRCLCDECVFLRYEIYEDSK